MELRSENQLATTDSWKAADIGLFDPAKSFKDGMETISQELTAVATVWDSSVS